MPRCVCKSIGWKNICKFFIRSYIADEEICVLKLNYPRTCRRQEKRNETNRQMKRIVTCCKVAWLGLDKIMCRTNSFRLQWPSQRQSGRTFWTSKVSFALSLKTPTFCNWMCQLGFISIIIYTFNYTLSKIEVWIMYNIYQKILPFFFHHKTNRKKSHKIFAISLHF